MMMRRSLPLATPPVRAVCELHFVKRGHYYRFRCPKGEEVGLLYTLFEAALDPQLNLDLVDVRRIATALRQRRAKEAGRP